MKYFTSLTLLTLFVALPAVASIGESDHEIKKHRIVKVVTPGGSDLEHGEDFVFVGDDKEPLVVRSFFFQYGGYLGVQLVDLTPELREHFGVPGDAGVMISAVSDDGPAARAGLEVGDVVSAIDGNEVANGSELARLVRAGKEGDTVGLEVWRDGKVMRIEATLDERKKPQVDIGPFVWRVEGDAAGLADQYEMHLENLPESVIRIDEDHIEKALGALTERLESPEWTDRMRAMVEERQGMEERIRELEQRLRELEQRLQKLAN